ncbi:hypothetical protein [Streptomyces omiyaensis]|uniref:Uncharacterized protein n=1 Tax=Streptomyces omiyaensis TaxID=68247 RepID=A0ABW7BY33_9ACTN|nr:hypothetical protein [Streptomyces omiyaensis]GGY63040.1 hypothetical protein GCM10010363_50530 [Streptomyces omiyaensis]
MKAKRLAVLGGGLLVVGAFLASALGWDPRDPGTITAQQLRGEWTGEGGAFVEFRTDGTFCARDFPVERSPERLITSCGDWSFSDDGDRDQGIDLDFDRPSFALISMVRVAGSGGEGGLYVLFDVDDASDRAVLHRRR